MSKIGDAIYYLTNLRSRYNLPQWIIGLNYLGMMPLAVWPFVFFGSVFLFDNPKNFSETFLLFLLINSYPLALIGNMILSFKLFHKARFISVVLPFLPIIAFTFLLYDFIWN